MDCIVYATMNVIMLLRHLKNAVSRWSWLRGINSNLWKRLISSVMPADGYITWCRRRLLPRTWCSARHGFLEDGFGRVKCRRSTTHWISTSRDSHGLWTTRFTFIVNLMRLAMIVNFMRLALWMCLGEFLRANARHSWHESHTSSKPCKALRGLEIWARSPPRKLQFSPQPAPPRILAISWLAACPALQ